MCSSDLRINITQLPTDTSVPARKSDGDRTKRAAYSYVSVVDGTPMRHATWAECEARVKGQSGARFKKASSAADEGEILRSWNVDPAALD